MCKRLPTKLVVSPIVSSGLLCVVLSSSCCSAHHAHPTTSWILFMRVAHRVCPGFAVTRANPASLDQADWWYGPPPLWRASKAPEPLLYPRPTAAGWSHTVLEDFSWPLVHLACWSILPVYPNSNPWSQVKSISPCRQYWCAQEVILNQVHTYLELSV